MTKAIFFSYSYISADFFLFAANWPVNLQIEVSGKNGT